MDGAGTDRYVMELISMAGMLALSLVALGWVFHQLQRAKKINQQLLHKDKSVQTKQADVLAANETLVGMVKTIAHDLRSPMNAIVGITSLLNKSTALTKTDVELVEMIHRSATHAQALTSRLLEYNYSVSEKGKSSVVNLHDFLTKITTLIQVNAFSKEQEIDFRSRGQYAANINTESMWQVIDNLIGNAIKFSPPKSTIVVRLAAPDEHRIAISVIDRGIGIPPAFVHELFKPASKVRRTGTAGEKSFGLGLAICKQIVEAHQGTIRYESNQGKGSIFTVELPRAPLELAIDTPS